MVNEPRGSDVVVGALLVPPSDASCVTGVIFFNNVGYLGMCGHGTIGLVVTNPNVGILTDSTSDQAVVAMGVVIGDGAVIGANRVLLILTPLSSP